MFTPSPYFIPGLMYFTLSTQTQIVKADVVPYTIAGSQTVSLSQHPLTPSSTNGFQCRAKHSLIQTHSAGVGETMKSIANTDDIFLSAFSCLFSPARYHRDSSRRQLNGETEGYSKVCWCEEKKTDKLGRGKQHNFFIWRQDFLKRCRQGDWSMARRLSESLWVSPVNIVSKLIWLASWRR